MAAILLMSHNVTLVGQPAKNGNCNIIAVGIGWLCLSLPFAFTGFIYLSEITKTLVCHLFLDHTYE